MLRYSILMETQKYVSPNCRNWNFEAGRAMDGISLVDAGTVYPKYTERQRYSVNLVARASAGIPFYA